MKRLAVVIALASASPAFAAAGDLRDLCANRPGKGSPTCVLDAGHWQVEGDLMDQSRDKTGGLVTTGRSVADVQIRYGLTHRMELEASVAPFLYAGVRGSGHQTGSSDLTLAARYALTDPDGKGAAAALQPFVVAPTGAHGFGAGGWEGGIALPVSMPISDAVALGGSPQMTLNRNASGIGTHAAWSGAIGVSETVGTVTFGQELWGAADQDPSGHTRQASLDLTAAWQPRALPDTQLDLGFNAGLNRHTPDREVYLGLARRF